MYHKRTPHPMYKYSRLILRNRVYYIRVRIPANLVYLAKTTQYCYSLQTHNYYEAVALLRKESYKIDMKINLLRSIDMKIRNKELILDDTDIDKLVIHKLRSVEKSFERYYEEIADSNFDTNKLKILKTDDSDKNSKISKSEKELDCIEVYIKEYFNDLKTDKRTPISVVKQIGRIAKEEIPIITDKDKPAQHILDIRTAFRGLDRYIEKKTKAIIEDIPYNSNTHGTVARCLKAIDMEKNMRAISNTNTQTPWQRIFNEYSRNKTNLKSVVETTIDGNKACLETIFGIIGKEYIENVNHKDCQFINDFIYNLPKHWQFNYKIEELKSVISSPTDNKISITTAKKYLRTFKEFMLFCRKRRYISDSFNDEIELTARTNPIIVDGFTPNELKTIFNPSYYPRKNNIYYPYRFWIPLIALYSGMRLNEICQLYVDDIKNHNNVWYFSITDERDDQHLKNKPSKRNVPIHPKLLEFGFLDFVENIRSFKKDRLFHQLTFSKKTRYTHAMGAWFGRYLTKLKIEGRNKVFHSFRHLVKPMLRDAGIGQEYQNAICGWSAKDVGERIYGGEIPIEILNNEISKLQYPFLDKTLKELMKLNNKGS